MGHFPHQKRIADRAKPCQSAHLKNWKILRDTLGLKQKQCVREAAASQRGRRPLQKLGLSPLVSSHGFVCDRLYVRADMCIQTGWTGGTRWRHTSDNCLDRPGFVNYIPLEMNWARHHVIAPDYQQTELSSGLAANQAELSTGANSLFALVRPRAPHYDWVTPATPNVKMSRIRASVPPPPTLPLLCPDSRSKTIFPEAHKILYFSNPI